jgi:hypothetical protein
MSKSLPSLNAPTQPSHSSELKDTAVIGAVGFGGGMLSNPVANALGINGPQEKNVIPLGKRLMAAARSPIASAGKTLRSPGFKKAIGLGAVSGTIGLLGDYAAVKFNNKRNSESMSKQADYHLIKEYLMTGLRDKAEDAKHNFSVMKDPGIGYQFKKGVAPTDYGRIRVRSAMNLVKNPLVLGGAALVGSGAYALSSRRDNIENMNKQASNRYLEKIAEESYNVKGHSGSFRGDWATPRVNLDRSQYHHYAKSIDNNWKTGILPGVTGLGVGAGLAYKASKTGGRPALAGLIGGSLAGGLALHVGNKMAHNDALKELNIMHPTLLTQD